MDEKTDFRPPELLLYSPSTATNGDGCSDQLRAFLSRLFSLSASIHSTSSRETAAPVLPARG